MHERALRALPWLAVALLAAPAGLSGCLDFLPQNLQPRPDLAVARTNVAVGPGAWNRDSTFVVQVNEPQPHEVTIEAKPASGRAPLAASGLSDASTSVTLEIPDGTWTISYSVDGYKWETFPNARFDGTPPEITGLESLGSAPSGSYSLGAGAVIEPGATVTVVDQATELKVGDGLPVQLSGLGNGVYAYDVKAEDDAGNQAVWTVQVVAGSATQLPEGQLTMGIVARYRTTAALWDLSDLDDYMSPAAARAAQPGFLGSGVGIAPDDPDVQAIVAEVVQPGMTTAEAALELFTWMFANLDYDRARLDETDLLEPGETIAAGGGVCRDLAGLYVSLLRASGIPARLVAGYLGGEVNGFHAWVEFYGGVAPTYDPTGARSSWVPVDVSGITGDYDTTAMLQSFGVRKPEYLMLRAVTPEQEQMSSPDWASAMTSVENPPPGSTAETDLAFDTVLSDVTTPTTQKLCINRDTLFREFRATSSKTPCSTPRGEHIPGFVTGATQVLDYGVRIGAGPDGSKITLTIVFPDLSDTSADSVEFLTYGPDSSEGCPRSTETGRATCVVQR